MAFFEWDDNYSVGVAEIDEQHQELIELINRLHEAIEQGSAGNAASSAINELDTMSSVLDELVDYSCYHFSTEEKYMLEYTYPEYDRHKRLHAQFVDRVEAFKRDYEATRGEPPVILPPH